MSLPHPEPRRNLWNREIAYDYAEHAADLGYLLEEYTVCVAETKTPFPDEGVMW